MPNFVSSIKITMKKLFVFFLAVILGISGFAQPITNPDNFILFGIVKNSSTGTPIPNWPVRVRALNGITFNQVVQTNVTGNYLVEVKNGSLTGPSIYFEVATLDCDSVVHADTVSNLQGTLDLKNVNFAICQKPLALCKAGFKYDPVPLNPLRFVFTNLSLGEGLTFRWTINGIFFSDLKNPEYTFPLSGTYEVCLKVFRGNPVTCTDTYCSKIIVGSNTGSTCNAQFDFVKTSTNASVSGKPLAPINLAYTYVWTISSNGVNQTVLGYNPVLPLGIGLNKVCLRVYGAGCDQNFCKEINVPAPPTTIDCDPSFKFQDSLKAPATITFYGKDVQTADKGFKHYWTFGDGTPVGEGLNPVHVFEKPGKYNVCHKVINLTANCEKYLCRVITILPKDSIVCQAYFGYKFSTIVPNRVIFQNLSLGINSTSKYKWTYGDGSKPDSTFNAEHTYSSPGVFNVCLTVTTGNCTNTICKDVKIENPQQPTCDAGFKFQDSLKAPATVNFISNTSQTTANGFIHSWYFGDNTFSNKENPEHIYLKPGKYNVCHKVVNLQSNCEKVLCRVVTILPADTISCKAYFEHYPSSTNPGKIIFKNLSLGVKSSTEYLWNFGYGSKTDSSFNAEHTFPGPGTYTVCLKIKGGECVDLYCKTIVIPGDPATCNPNFKWETPFPNNPLKVAFYAANGSNSNLVHVWKFTLNGHSVLPNPVFTFPAPGKYKVCHHVWNPVTQCKDSACQVITVGIPPSDSSCKAKFIWYSSDSNPLKIGFKNTSTGNTTSLWSFGDGTYSTDANPTHLYPNAGIYNVCLKIKSGNCTDSYCAQVNIQKDSGGFTIGGIVWAGSKRADLCKVRLIKRDPISKALTLYATTVVDSNGRYTFTNVPSGIYLIRAALTPGSKYFDNYIPTYFGSQFYWLFAEPVVVNANGDSYNISLIYCGFKKGPGIFGGGVKGPHRMDEQTLSEASIIVTGLDDAPQGWTTTDENGNFNISSLDYGTYRMWADFEGLECEPVEFTISPENPSVEFTVTLGNEVTIVRNISKASIFKSEIFPNPANDIAQMDLELDGSTSVSVHILNLAGQVVYSAGHSGISGQQRLSIPVSTIPDGLYLINIRDNNTNQLLGVKRLTIAH